MKNVLICNHNSTGLINDNYILKELLSKKFKVDSLIYSESEIYTINQEKNYDIIIFLEHIAPNICSNTSKNIFIPNCEMINKNDYNLLIKKKINEIIVKTNLSYSALIKYNFNIPIKLWKWNSIDRLDSNLSKDFNNFLHLKGQSRFKNSQQLLNLWLKHPDWPILHIVSYGNPNHNGFLEIQKPINVCNNIILYQYKLDENELKNLMNFCGVHICPSIIEGYGHYINEARSTNSIIIVPDHEPMKSFCDSNGFLIKINKTKKIGFSEGCEISDKELEKSIESCINTDYDTRVNLGKKSRYLFEENRKCFLNQIL